MTFQTLFLAIWGFVAQAFYPLPGPRILSSNTIAYDASANGSITLSGTSLTWSHTTSGSNRVLFVGAFGDTLIADPTCAKITGATYNSVSMTQVPTVSPVGVPGDRCIYLFYLVAPATGANNVVVSASSAIVIAGLSSSYTGAKQTGVPDVAVNNTQSNTATFTTSLTVATTNSWMILYTKNNFDAPGAGTGSTSRQSTANGHAIFDSNGPLATGSQSMAATSASSTSDWGSIMVSIAPL